MILGYGDVGRLAVKYLLCHKISKIYLVVRNMSIINEIEDDRVEVISFDDKNKYINDVDCVIAVSYTHLDLITELSIVIIKIVYDIDF